MIHELKIYNEYFEDVLTGVKSFEIRKNDRNFNVGDLLALNEFDGVTYTGRCCLVSVDYIMNNPDYVKENMVVMSIKPCVVMHKSDIYEPASMRIDYSCPLVPNRREFV